MKNRSILILILGLLSAIGPFSIDTYLSGFPTIAKDLGVTVDEVAYSLSSFFIGISVGQLIYGPLLDRFGRKKPLMIGLSIYLVASLACATANSVEVLIAARFLQALGACVGMVAPRAIVRDIFPVEETAKIFSLLMLILGVSPIIAPSVGSYMITLMGWHSVFYMQFGLGVILFLSCYFALPESKKPDESISLKPRAIIFSFIDILKVPQFYTYAFAGALISAGVYAYLSGSPFVFMKLFGVSEKEYGWIFGFLAGGLIASSQVNTLLLKKFSSSQVVRVSLRIQTLVGLTLCLVSILGWLNLYSALALVFLFLCCQGISYPNSSALSLYPFTKSIGGASALLGALQMCFGSLAAAAVSILSNGTSIPMTAVMASCAVLGLTVFAIGVSKLKHG